MSSHYCDCCGVPVFGATHQRYVGFVGYYVFIVGGVAVHRHTSDDMPYRGISQDELNRLQIKKRLYDA